MLQVLLLDELTTFLDGEDQKGVLEAVRNCVGGPDEVRGPFLSSMIKLSQHHPLISMLSSCRAGQVATLPRASRQLQMHALNQPKDVGAEVGHLRVIPTAACCLSAQAAGTAPTRAGAWNLRR